ncbi:YicC/YloC family endoribonuclease [Thalassolituus sp. LLYu03]|uniref:YicC/YloC family endoribonuclease n=1 Tax=Thalassolituus sp. LLYu03 TaxID=3421656 RepID=UPI003D290E79
MVCSMTAFARASADCAEGIFTWEIRSVNSRYLEPHFRLPDAFRDLEPLLRERLKKAISRGKIECGLRFQGQVSSERLTVNHDMVRELSRAADEVHAIIGPGNAMNVLEVLQWPGVLGGAEADSKALQSAALQAFDACLTALTDTRAREGADLSALISQRLQRMDILVAEVRKAMPEALAAQKQQLLDRFADLQLTVDPSRIESEIVLLAQKADVAEELDRLSTHMQEVTRNLNLDEPVGRRLDFMMQELNREANTLSSKSLTTGITQAAVELKVLIEQMREQVQNIE